MSSGTQHSSSDIENKVQEAYQQWKRLDRNPDTLYELEALYEDRHKPTMMQQLIKRLITNRLEFGTAGLRGPMGVGFNHMNDVVVLQTALGIARHLLALKKDTQNEKITQDDGGVVIGYDSRHNSKRFAALSANINACLVSWSQHHTTRNRIMAIKCILPQELRLSRRSTPRSKSVY